MKDKIIARLKQIGRGYELDKLPPALLKAVIESALPLIEKEIEKAEGRAIYKQINERFVAKAIKTALEKKPERGRPNQSPTHNDPSKDRANITGSL